MNDRDYPFEAKRLADEWAIARGFMNIEHFQRESFVGASVKVGTIWYTFPGKRLTASEEAAGRDRDMQQEGRALINQWAKERGYADVDDMAAKLNVPWVDLYTQHCHEVLAASPRAKGWKRLGEVMPKVT